MIHALPLNVDEAALISILSLALTIAYRSLRYTIFGIASTLRRLTETLRPAGLTQVTFGNRGARHGRSRARSVHRP
jgi:hypothetical protein